MANNIREFVEILETEIARKEDDFAGGSAYDFIAENYMSFSKSELADIIKELLYSVHGAQRRHDIMWSDYETIMSDTAQELQDRYHWEWED